MWRLKIWFVAFAPMVIGLIVLFNFNETVGTIIMYLFLLTVPAAIKIENKVLAGKGIDTNNGSPIGNNLARFFGFIVVGGAIWIFYILAHNLYTGNY